MIVLRQLFLSLMMPMEYSVGGDLLYKFLYIIYIYIICTLLNYTHTLLFGLYTTFTIDYKDNII